MFIIKFMSVRFQQMNAWNADVSTLTKHRDIV